jgi:hypothetical protein
VSELLTLAAYAHRFMRRHRLDPSEYTLVLRGKDDKALYELQRAVLDDLRPEFIDRQVIDSDFRHMKLHGVSIALSSLDISR